MTRQRDGPLFFSTAQNIKQLLHTLHHPPLPSDTLRLRLRRALVNELGCRVGNALMHRDLKRDQHLRTIDR
jgi:hypothetical protein